MKQRMITVFCGIALLCLILLFYKTPVLNAAIAFVCVLTVYEIFSATKNIQHKGLMLICMAAAAIVPFTGYLSIKNVTVLTYFAFFLAVFIYTLKFKGKVKLSEISLCLLVTALFSASLNCIVCLRNEFVTAGKLKELALFYIALVFIGSWITDAGGLIFGSLFGKHKLSPTVSPQKTVEGAVGGIALTVICFVGALYAYGAYVGTTGVSVKLNLLSTLILSVLSAVVSIVGDLAASLIKRENSIKDFGNILPGHGGMLDRFDSILFVAPLILMWARLFPLVTV